MAHVAVVRRSMRPEEWTDLRFVWLQRGIVADQEEVTGLTIPEGGFVFYAGRNGLYTRTGGDT